MTITVTIPSDYSYDGTPHTYRDDSDPDYGLDGGGHVARFLPAIKDVLSMVEYVANSNVVGDVAAAEVAATSAGNSASEAQGYSLEAQNYSLATTATSSTSLTVGTGSKTLTVGTNKAFKVGQYVTIAQTSTPANYMAGQVTSYSGSSLVVNVITTGGSGTATGWTVALSGVPGLGSLSATVDNSFTVDQTIDGIKVGVGTGTGVNNTRVGASSGDSISSGNNNALFGYSAGNALSVGINNSAIGSYSLSTINNSNNNTALGYKTLQIYSDYNGGNVAVGSEAGLSLASGSNNTYVGYQAGSSMVTYSNSGAFGYNALPGGSNQIKIGNSATTVYTQSGTVSASDQRDKADIRDTTLGLSFINSLRPVDYKWDIRLDYAPAKPEQGEMTDEQYKTVLQQWAESCKPANLTHDGSKKRNRYHHGLIAQELGSLLQAQGIDFGGYQNFEVNGGEALQAVVYEELIAPMIKAIQELSARVVALENK